MEEIKSVQYPKFSVAMSVYKKDSAEFFDRALQSVMIKQTILPNEVVLIVDGPVGDEIESVIKNYQEKGLQLNVIRLQKNGGLGNALRLAVENCSNELIARMDSDDVAVENRFEQQLKILQENPEIDVVGGDITEFIGEEENIVSKRELPTNNADIKKYLKKRCPFNHMTVMFKKQTVLRAGNYQDWFCNEDYFLWLRMHLCESIFANSGTILVNVRVGKEMYQRRGGRKYYKSEKRLQKFMLKSKIIGLGTYLSNVLKRFVVQVLMPNKLRGWVFKKFARTKVK